MERYILYATLKQLVISRASSALDYVMSESCINFFFNYTHRSNFILVFFFRLVIKRSPSGDETENIAV